MDQAPLRRGQPTVHEKWNGNVAILSGDVMLVNAYQLLLHVEADKLAPALARFSRTAAEVCEGQQMDMNFETRWDVSEAEYIDMIRLKTSVLLGYALELGGLIGGADEETTRHLYEGGMNIGIGFQLKDDLLDVYGDPAKFGKQVGGDIIANKKTFLLIEALAQAKGSIRDELTGWLTRTDFNKQEKVKAVTAIYDQLGIRQLTETRINEYFALGFANFDQVNADPDRKNVINSIRPAVGRTRKLNREMYGVGCIAFESATSYILHHTVIYNLMSITLIIIVVTVIISVAAWNNYNLMNRLDYESISGG